MISGRGDSVTRKKSLGGSFEFREEKWSGIDPSLIVAKELDPIDLEAESPASIAVGSDDAIYVGAESRVIVFGPSGEKRSALPVSGRVECLDIDSAGQIYAGIENHIEVYRPGGEFVEAWEAPEEDSLITSIAVTEDRVYVSDGANGFLVGYDKLGRELGRSGGLVRFSVPGFDLDAAPDGGIWVVNPGRRELRKYNADLEQVGAWQRISRHVSGFSGCCNPTDIALMSDGSIVTAEKNIVRVKVVSPEGELRGVIAGPDSFDEETARLDIAVDSNGRVLALDKIRRQVRVFVPEGEKMQ